MEDQTLESKYKNIFQIMLQGDMKIEKLKKQVIAIVGKTRSGKSTLTNWICAVPMTAQQSYGNHYYKTSADDPNKLGHGVVSQTLVPNIQQIDDDTSAVDMAGYGDTRNYIGVLGVSHMLKLVFQQAQKLKFILVVDETDINSGQGKTKFQPFKHFIDMFKMDTMSSEAKQQILQSVTIVINKANKNLQNIYLSFQGLLKEINRPGFKYEKKNFIIELLQYCRNNKKIQLFELAKQGLPCPNCTILQDFEQTKKWNYVNFRELQKSQGKQIISLPFAQLYKQLEADQKQKFVEQVKERTNFYKNCLSLFQIALKTPQERTKEGTEKQEKANWYRKSINYQKFFKQLFDILKNYNLYQQDQYEIPEKYKQSYTQLKYEEKNDPPTGIQLIEILGEIYIQTVKLQGKRFDQSYANFLTRMQKTMKKTLKKVKKILCKNKKNQEQFNELAFIYLRGFQQFRMLVEIDPKLISATPQSIANTIQQYFTESIDYMKTDFLLGLRTQYIRNLPFSALQKLIALGQEISEGKIAKGFNKQDIKTKQMSIQQSFAYILLKQENFKRALNSFINVGIKIQKFIKLYEKEDSDEQDENIPVNQTKTKTNIKKDIFMMRITNIGKIAECLQKLKYYRKALPLYTAINYVPSAIRCYDQIIKQSTEQRLQAYIAFANYCMNVGNTSKALQLLQISYQLCQSQADFFEVEKNITQLATMKQNPVKKFKEKINAPDADLLTQIQDVKQFAQDQGLVD